MESEPQNQTIEETIPIRPQISSDLIRWMLSGDDIAEEIEVELTGRKTYNGKVIIVNEYKHKNRLINDAGINSIKIIITSNIGKGTINSNLDEEDIRCIMNDIRRDLNDKIFMMWDKWEIKKEDSSTIRAVVENNCTYALKRAFEALTSAKVYGAVKRTEVSSNQINKKSSGFMGWMGLK